MDLSRCLIAGLAVFAASGASAAQIENPGPETETVEVTAKGVKSQIVLESGERTEFCQAGCFVTFADGEIAALAGDEKVSVAGGKGRVLDGGD